MYFQKPVNSGKMTLPQHKNTDFKKKQANASENLLRHLSGAILALIQLSERS